MDRLILILGTIIAFAIHPILGVVALVLTLDYIKWANGLEVIN